MDRAVDCSIEQIAGLERIPCSFTALEAATVNLINCSRSRLTLDEQQRILYYLYQKVLAGVGAGLFLTSSATAAIVDQDLSPGSRRLSLL